MASTSAGGTMASKPLAWQKITAAYTAQAKAHGYSADCTRWNRVMSMRCTLTGGGHDGQVFPAWRPDGCTVTVSFHATTLQAQYVDVNTCKPRWWRTVMPAPWTDLAA